MKHLLLGLCLIPILSFSQTRKQKKALEAQQKADQVVITSLKNHAASLANNTSAKETSLNYITSHFKSSGLQPKGTNGYLQQFQVEDGRQIDNTTSLKVNGSELQVNKDFFPLSYSASKTVKGMPAMALREKGVPWFFDVRNLLNDNTITADFTIDKAIQKEAMKVAAKGATALFLYNSGNNADGVVYNKMDKMASLPIPVVYIMSDGYKKYFSDDSQMLDIELKVALKESSHLLNNMVGYLDNSAPASIIITSALNKTEGDASPTNIGGTAILLELVKMITATKAKSNNYIFIVSEGESAEEAGAKYWFNNSTVATPINYGINLSSIPAEKPVKKLVVNGVETSAVWNGLLTSSTAQNQLVIEVSENQAKRKDLNTFYQKNIPVLSLSPIINEEDSKTSVGDNSAMLQIAKFVNKLIETADAKGKIAFSNVSGSSPMIGGHSATSTDNVPTSTRAVTADKSKSQ
jgi:ribosomal protein S8